MELPKPYQFSGYQLEQMALSIGHIHAAKACDGIANEINAIIRNYHEWMFDGAIEVYTTPSDMDVSYHQFWTERLNLHTHRAILLKPESIVKGVSKDEILAVLRDMPSFGMPGLSLKDLANRIEKEGIRD